MEQVKTTAYLPRELKTALTREAAASGRSEAQIIREAIADAVTRPRPTPGLLSGEPIAERTDELRPGSS